MTDSTTEKNADDSFPSCDDPADDKTCVAFGGLKFDSTGKLIDLTVNGKTIGDRLTVGNGQAVSAGGAKFTFLTAYKSIQSNALFVTLKVQSGKRAISPNIYSATYRGPDGKQREATAAFGPLDLDANSNAVLTVVFQGVKVGGKVSVDGCVGEGCSASFKTSVKVG